MHFGSAKDYFASEVNTIIWEGYVRERSFIVFAPKISDGVSMRMVGKSQALKITKVFGGI